MGLESLENGHGEISLCIDIFSDWWELNMCFFPFMGGHFHFFIVPGIELIDISNKLLYILLFVFSLVEVLVDISPLPRVELWHDWFSTIHKLFDQIELIVKVFIFVFLGTGGFER